MGTWKKILLWAVGIGAGFAITAALIVGGFMWWSNRPPKPKPWNQNAITAKFDTLDVQGQDNHVYFSYTLENHTDSDFTLTDNSGVHLGASLKRGNSISFSNDDYLSTTYPIYIPAKHNVRVVLNIKYPYNAPISQYATDDEKSDWKTKLAGTIVKEMTNLDGFVLMDDASRYQINFPNGWADRAKEPMKVKK
jgi:hypothetical protein